MEDNIPRKACLDKLEPAEKAIYDAMQKVEEMPADVRLTDAVNLLQQAFDKVAEYIDNSN